MPILDAKDICVRLGKKDILRNVSFSIEKGEIIGVLGKNGSGKTTIIKVLAGLIKPNNGRIIIEGRLANSMEASKLIGYCPQENSFFEKLSVKENIEYFGHLYSINSKEMNIIIKKVAYLLGIEEKMDEMAGNLSGGQKRRLNIACSIMHSPEILLMDEPSLALDPMSRANLWNLIRTINSTGTTIFISSNNLEEIRMLCDKIIAIRDGSVVFSGTFSEFSAENLMSKIF